MVALKNASGARMKLWDGRSIGPGEVVEVEPAQAKCMLESKTWIPATPKSTKNEKADA